MKQIRDNKPSRLREPVILDETPTPGETERPSRSQRRREALATLALAEQLVALPPARVDALDLPDEVREEIVNVRGISAHGARKRQLAHLARLMRRHEDAAFAGARAALGDDRQRHRRETAALQRVEALREDLIDGKPGVLTALVDQYPQMDRQRLNALIRQARVERKRDKPPRATRELFRLLRELPPA